MASKDRKRITCDADGEYSLADQSRRRPVGGSALCAAADAPGAGRTSWQLDDALHALALAERRLFGVQRENIGLRKNNEHLMEALDSASRRAVAAVRVAQHDGLTGLPNRLLLIKRLRLAILQAAERQVQLAIVFIDLDGFKKVNDQYGHRVADRLLSAVGARIAAGIRAEDLACRYGGDEFVALLPNLRGDGVADRVAEKIRRNIGRIYSIDGFKLQIGASVGVAVYPNDGERHDALLQHADAAMFRDKAARRAKGGLCEMAGDARATNQRLSTETCATS